MPSNAITIVLLNTTKNAWKTEVEIKGKVSIDTVLTHYNLGIVFSQQCDYILGFKSL